MTTEPTLRRSLSLPLIVLYGLGTTIGAGIYVLIGKVAGAAGMFAPAAFLVASLLAAFTAFSFAELSSRMPRSAGEAVYVNEGFDSARLALLVGLLVASAGVISSATIIQGSVGYIHAFIDVADWLAIALLVIGLAAIAAWGITSSVLFAAAGTLIEIAGLLLVIWGGLDQLGDLPARLPELVPPADGAVWVGIASGAVLAFYAFLGFEDMVNVAEETKDPRRTLPRAIILTLIVTLVLYMLLSVIAVFAVSRQELAESRAPLALLFERTAGASPAAINLIAIVSVINGALIQIIMASRVIYGLAALGWLPVRLAAVHPRTRTPLTATSLVGAVILVLALWLPVETLARATSLVTLTIFAVVNLALWRIKGRAPAPEGVASYPRWIPLVGFVASAGFAIFQLLRFLGV